MSNVVIPLVLLFVGSGVLMFVIGRRLEHFGPMTTPYTGPVDDLDEERLVTLTGKVEPLEGLIPSPFLGDPPVLAWSLETIAGGSHRGQLVSRWAPFRLNRPEGTPLDVRRLLKLAPKNSRTERKFAEQALDTDALLHLRRQQQASNVQFRQIESWFFEDDEYYEPAEADYDVPEPVAPTTKKYRLSVLRPDDDLTTVTRLKRISEIEEPAAEVFLFPRFTYPLPYPRAKSPFHGQGRFVLALSAAAIGVLGLTSVLVWLLLLAFPT